MILNETLGSKQTIITTIQQQICLQLSSVICLEKESCRNAGNFSGGAKWLSWLYCVAINHMCNTMENQVGKNNFCNMNVFFCTFSLLWLQRCYVLANNRSYIFKSNRISMKNVRKYNFIHVVREKHKANLSHILHAQLKKKECSFL